MSMFSVLASQRFIDTIAPTAVQNLVTTTTQSSASIRLDWSPASDNVAVAGYQIWRSEEFGAFTVLS
jgi:hypothetical protein